MRKMSSVRMVSGRAGSRCPNDVMRSQFHLSHPSFSSFLLLCCFTSRTGSPFKVAGILPAASCYIEQGLGNYGHKGWPPGFVNKTVLNTAMPLCVHLSVAVFMLQEELNICNSAVWPIKPKVFRICLYGKGLLTPAGEARFC